MTAIDYLVEQLQKEYKWFPSTQSELIIKAKMMEKVQSEQYAQFAVLCDRKQLKVIEFNDFNKLM